MRSVSIIGGGIIGQFCAYYLSNEGYQVCIIDDNPEMNPASVGNCGLIVPSHVLPMNSLATIWQGVKWMGKKDAPLSIKPQFDYTFFNWFLQFALASRSSVIERNMKLRHELLQQSWNLYETFFTKEQIALEWKKEGLVYVCHTERTLAHIQHEFDALQKYNLKSRLLTKDELLEMEPLLIGDQILGGAIFDVDSWLNPGELLATLRKINIEKGVQIIQDSVLGLEQSKRRLTNIVGSLSQYQSDVTVLCAGAKTPLLARKLGKRLPMIPGKGYNITTSQPLPTQPNHPIYLLEKKVVATPWANGFRLGSTMEFSGFDLSLNPERLAALKRAATQYLKLDLSDVNFEPWAGWRPMTPDGIPIIEPMSDTQNVVVATGHGMLGLSMAPATGWRVMELINQMR